jgi:hypothetical protein
VSLRWAHITTNNLAKSWRESPFEVSRVHENFDHLKVRCSDGMTSIVQSSNQRLTASALNLTKRPALRKGRP